MFTLHYLQQGLQQIANYQFIQVRLNLRMKNIRIFGPYPITLIDMVGKNIQ